MILYQEELKNIAALVEIVSKFNQTMIDWSVNGTISVDYDGFSVTVVDINGKTLGVIGYTDDGDIGFTSWGHEEQKTP